MTKDNHLCARITDLSKARQMAKEFIAARKGLNENEIWRCGLLVEFSRCAHTAHVHCEMRF